LFRKNVVVPGSSHIGISRCLGWRPQRCCTYPTQRRKVWQSALNSQARRLSTLHSDGGGELFCGPVSTRIGYLYCLVMLIFTDWRWINSSKYTLSISGPLVLKVSWRLGWSVAARDRPVGALGLCIACLCAFYTLNTRK
jgi:hypothetical protein